MGSDGRLLLIERIVSEPGQPSEAKMFDLNMMVVCGGRERTTKEHRELLASAGLKLQRVIPTGNPLSLLEVTVA